MECLHKICEIYAIPPNDTKKVLEVFENTRFLISSCWDGGEYKYEVFEKTDKESF